MKKLLVVIGILVLGYIGWVVVSSQLAAQSIKQDSVEMAKQLQKDSMKLVEQAQKDAMKQFSEALATNQTNLAANSSADLFTGPNGTLTQDKIQEIASLGKSFVDLQKELGKPIKVQIVNQTEKIAYYKSSEGNIIQITLNGGYDTWFVMGLASY